MRVSLFEKEQYAKCQRMYYLASHHVSVDAGWRRPLYFDFSKAANEILKAFEFDCMRTHVPTMRRICRKHGITGKYDQARVMIAVRSYFASWPKSDVTCKFINVHSDVQDEFVSIVLREGDDYWILAHKFTSQISKDIAVEMVTDEKICTLLKQREDVEKFLSLSAGSVKGIRVRIVKKNTQVAGGARSLGELQSEFLARANNGQSLEIQLLPDDVSMWEFDEGIRMIASEISQKGDNMELFEQNLEKCVWNKKENLLCPYHSTCHSNSCDIDDDSLDF